MSRGSSAPPAWDGPDDPVEALQTFMASPWEADGLASAYVPLEDVEDSGDDLLGTALDLARRFAQVWRERHGTPETPEAAARLFDRCLTIAVDLLGAEGLLDPSDSSQIREQSESD